MSERLDRITAALESANERYQSDRARIFKDEGVTAEQYYDAFWEDWLKRREGDTNK